MTTQNEDLLISIITPYYNTLQATLKLASILEPQLTDDIEWIIIDDGCHETELDKIKANIIHLEKNSGGASYPRNVGLDTAHGKYICFIDSDDLVSEDYIQTIVDKIHNSDFDYCYFGWESKHFKVPIKHHPPTWNCSLWNCIYKRDIIGDERFDTNLIVAEDYDFNQRVRKGKHSYIEKFLYYYNDTPNSLTKRGVNKNV